MLGMQIERKLPKCKDWGGALLAVLLLLVPASARGQSWTWTTETADTSGKSTSLGVDDQGNVHLSYLTDQSSVKYAFRPADSARWFTMHVDGVGSGYETTPTKLALDQQGNPHICYTPGKIKYAFFDGRQWNKQEIASKSGQIEFNCAVAIATDGTPHVSWYHLDLSPSGTGHLRYAVLQDGVWFARTIDMSAQTGKWHSLVVDAQGHPHFTYDAFVNGQLKYSYWDGRNWYVRVVDSRSARTSTSDRVESIGMGSSLVLDGAGKAYISYEDDKTLRYARQKDSSWTIEIVDMISTSGSWVGYRSRQVLDSRGFPHISYEDAGAVKHAHWDGKQWRVQVISPAGIYGARFPDIAIGRDDTLYMSYRDALDGSLRVAVGRPAAASQTSTADNKEKH